MANATNTPFQLLGCSTQYKRQPRGIRLGFGARSLRDEVITNQMIEVGPKVSMTPDAKFADVPQVNSLCSGSTGQGKTQFLPPHTLQDTMCTLVPYTWSFFLV